MYNVEGESCEHQKCAGTRWCKTSDTEKNCIPFQYAHGYVLEMRTLRKKIPKNIYIQSISDTPDHVVLGDEDYSYLKHRAQSILLLDQGTFATLLSTDQYLQAHMDWPESSCGN